jgi:hypothetical protein
MHGTAVSCSFYIPSFTTRQEKKINQFAYNVVGGIFSIDGKTRTLHGKMSTQQFEAMENENSYQHGKHK